MVSLSPKVPVIAPCAGVSGSHQASCHRFNWSIQEAQGHEGHFLVEKKLIESLTTFFWGSWKK